MAINDITMTGNIVFDPEFSGGNGKKSRTKFRIASTSRHRDPSGAWVDGDTVFIDVVCFDSLAENVVQSLGRGSPVIVNGRLKMRTVERAVESPDGQSTGRTRTVTYTSIIASAVGPDLSRVATQIRTDKSPAAMRQEEAALAEVADVMERDTQVA
jgi:single-strand DNA-binding protein